MNTSEIEQAIRDRIKGLDGKTFQQLFWDIMILRYADLQTPRMQQDKGSDGYSLGNKIFFACYAPESLKYDNSETKKKIIADYESFRKNWKERYPFEKWVFVTKENLMGVPHQCIVDLSANGDGLKKENWGVEQLVKETLCLSPHNIVRIYKLPDSYLVTAINEESDFGILGEVFEFVFSQKVSPADAGSIKKAGNYTELTEKLSLNFSAEELKTAREMILNNWQRKTLVEKYLQGEEERSPVRVRALVDQIQSDFRRIKGVDYHGVPIESVRIIEDLAREYLPTSKQSNPDYTAASRAIILYFFELCFLGKKTEKEDALGSNVFT